MKKALICTGGPRFIQEHSLVVQTFRQLRPGCGFLKWKTELICLWCNLTISDPFNNERQGNEQ